MFAGVSKSYGAVRAVDGVDLTIPCGQTVALLGPNGAGKSTTINMMLGLFPADRGRVELFGRSPEAASAAGRVGAMLQETKLVPRVTVGELLAFVRGLYPRPLPTDDLLRVANLGGLVGRRLEKLSGGQAQRVKFAVAIAGRPDLLVLDEPTAAMDVESRREFWASMRRYSRDGHTVLFSTHYVEEADESADRVVVIAGGRLVADGSPAEVRRASTAQTVAVALPYDGAAGLERLPGVTAVEVRGDRAYLTTTEPDAVVCALVERGLLRHVEVRGARLEDAYLALTA
ncbi:ABC transporter ATP-binding protein [Actinocatenispora rupis]|uniref:ABC transporter ATP-binding protein n=2 Tax=Actinocatenispora rupis TaxID=519421 RepID=A0A8J3NFQ8_9ACTN|nr:ABC transporter ATP-binding protein [Actinocatenispora rupis]